MKVEGWRKEHTNWPNQNVLEQTFQNASPTLLFRSTRTGISPVNKKAGEIFSRRPADPVGKNIWTEFPDAKQQPYIQALRGNGNPAVHIPGNTSYRTGPLVPKLSTPRPMAYRCFPEHLGKERAEQQLKTSEEKQD